MTAFTDLLACPRCDAPLHGLRCTACAVDYPSHGGVPWLFADPGGAASEWKNRWRLALERLDRDAARVRRALEGDLRPPTRLRMEALATGYHAQRENLRELMAPLELAEGGSLETLLALRTRLPPAQHILSYEANVHRDWCWGEHETRAALDALLAALGGSSVQRVLILGAGAGRLAYDLHQHTGAACTVALELNPLLAWVGERVCRGETLHLTEFPLAPRQPRDAAIVRALRAPAPARPGLVFVLGDALRAPFAPGAFDVVVTPWLLDVLDAPVTTVLPRINRLLADDGRWINQGSVAFEGPDPEQRITLDELLCIATQAGFADFCCREQCLPYLDCPDSRHGRREAIVTLTARKFDTAPAQPRHQSLPDWIVSGRSPVPALPAFQTQAMSTRVHAYIMSLIDGKRTLDDLARILEEQRLMPRADARGALRGFLTRMYEEAGGLV